MIILSRIRPSSGPFTLRHRLLFRSVPWRRLIVFGGVAMLAAGSAAAQERVPTGSESVDLAAGMASSSAPSAPQPRLRVGLVLSGGGARGAAHIGVLKVLEELRVPVDAIAGTSMGAVVGGLYASGLSAREIETTLSSVNWQESFRDTPARGSLAFRRKLEDRTFLVRLPLGLRGGDFRLPRGLLQGQKLTQLLRGLTLPVAATREFANLPTPFRAVATNLESGARELLDRGDLATAMRASVSAPGVFAPVEIDGKLLVDGGLVDNLPVDAARAMGVDVLIVVDVGFPLQERARLNSVATVSNQMLAILIRRGSDGQRKALQAVDELIEPQLGDASSFDFSVVTRAIALGEEATRARAGSLARLALPNEGYQAWVAQRHASRQGVARIDELAVAAAAQRYGPALRAEFASAVGKAPDAAGLDLRVTRVYGQGNFELVDYQLQALADGRTALALEARRNSWGPNYVRFGLNLQDDFEGNSSFNAAARFLITELNQRGAEWTWDLQLGESPRVATELFLPLDARARWFASPNAAFEVRTVALRREQTRIAEFRLRTSWVGLDVGRQFDNWGEWRAGARRVSGQSRVRLGDPALLGASFGVDEYFSRFSYDTLDDVNFPRSGQSISAEWRGERQRGRGAADNDVVAVDALIARSVDRHTGVLWVSAGDHVGSGPPNLRTQFALGGFLNLSGLAPQSVSGERFALARALYLRKIGRGGEGFLNVPTYVGASFEIGNVWNDRDALTLNSARKQGSVFLGLDTLLGPVYLGAGLGEEGESAYYLFLGRTF